MLTKKAFHRVGNHIINQYEVRRVEILKGASCPEGCEAIPKAAIHFKDGSKITVTSKHIPMLCARLLEV